MSLIRSPLNPTSFITHKFAHPFDDIKHFFILENGVSIDDKVMSELEQLLTGDHAKTAEYFAQQVGISKVRAVILPSFYLFWNC